MGEYQIRIDCDVLQADGGTRTASITGAYIALSLAQFWMKKNNILSENFLTDGISAVSCGIVNGEALLDLEYSEDSHAETDANFILTHSGNIVEIQATAEKKSFSQAQLLQMLDLAKKGCLNLEHIQKKALKNILIHHEIYNETA